MFPKQSNVATTWQDQLKTITCITFIDPREALVLRVAYLCLLRCKITPLCVVFAINLRHTVLYFNNSESILLLASKLVL